MPLQWPCKGDTSLCKIPELSVRLMHFWKLVGTNTCSWRTSYARSTSILSWLFLPPQHPWKHPTSMAIYSKSCPNASNPAAQPPAICSSGSFTCPFYVGIYFQGTEGVIAVFLSSLLHSCCPPPTKRPSPQHQVECTWKYETQPPPTTCIVILTETQDQNSLAHLLIFCLVSRVLFLSAERTGLCILAWTSWSRSPASDYVILPPPPSFNSIQDGRTLQGGSSNLLAKAHNLIFKWINIFPKKTNKWP